jgi:hypothetical protein
VQARGPGSNEQVRAAVTNARGVYSFKDLEWIAQQAEREL